VDVSLTVADVMNTVYDIGETGYEAVLTDLGWQGRKKPVGRRRSALLTAPCESPEQVPEALRRQGHL
jgi:hypothetical protein